MQEQAQQTHGKQSYFNMHSLSSTKTKTTLYIKKKIK